VALLLLVTVPGFVTAAQADTPYELTLPRGFPEPDIPADNPLTWEKVELGRLLFYDTRLSGNQTYSCETCHEQDKAFTDGLARSVGSTGQIHPRSAMSLANVVYAGTFTWADRLTPSLEEQMLVPMFTESPIIELGLGGQEDELFRRLQDDARYRRMFAEAFPGDPPDLISIRTITQALASFERILISGNSPYDRYVFGDDDAISASAVRGETLFFDEKRECFHCHAGFNFTTSVDHLGQVAERQFHNNALYNLNCASQGLPDLVLPQCGVQPTPGPGTPTPTPRPTCRPEGGPCHRCDGDGPQTMGCYPQDNTGLYERTGDTADMGRFKAPTLRNIAVTGPYMHDGSIATLSEVLDHYAAGGRTIADGPFAGDGSTSPAATQFMSGFTLTEREKTDLLNFLTALTDDEFLTAPHLSDPFAPVACPGDCDFNSTVEVHELVTGVNIALDEGSLARCLVSDLNADGAATINELLLAILAGLRGCG
jgi:cytochrome c peroxidase